MSTLSKDRPPFRKMFVLRPIEYVPVILAVLLGTGASVYAMARIQNGLDGQEVVADIMGLVGIFQYLGYALLAFGFGAWVLRLNRWLKAD